MKDFFLILFVLFFISPFALAAGGGEGIPWAIIVKQVINLSLFVGLMFWFLKDKVKSYFRNKAEDYKKQKEESLKFIKEAEKKFHDIKQALENLRNTKEADILQSKENAEKLKNEILSDGHRSVIKIMEEAKRTVSIETERVKRQMGDYAISQSIKEAKVYLKKDMTISDHKNLQDEFVNKVNG